MKTIRKILLTALLSMFMYPLFAQDCTTPVSDSYTLSLRANLLRWATLTPDLGLEWRISPSVGIMVNGSWTSWTWNDNARRYALREVMPEVRWYLGEKKAWYVGAMFKAGQFNYKFSGTGRQGDLLGGGISDLAALKGYTLRRLTTDATFSTLNCTLTPGTTIGDIAVTGIEDASGAEYTCTPLILVPQTVTGTIALEVAYNGQTYKAELNAPTAGLQAGYSYTYTVTVSNTKLEVSNAAISDWRTDRDFNGNGNATLR